MDKLRTFEDVEAVGADTHTGCLVLFQQGEVDAITGDDTVLAGLAAQDPYAEVVQAPAFTAEPLRPRASTGATSTSCGSSTASSSEMRADGRWTRATTPGSPTPWARHRPPAAGLRTGSRDLRDEQRHGAGRAGPARPAARREDALRYLEALGTWRDERKAELDVLDEAALGAADGAAYTGDLLLSMALWKAVADRHDLLVATWDSGRVGTDRAGAAVHPRLGRLDAPWARPAGPPPAPHVPAGALAVSLPEACRLSDALAASLRARLGIDPSEADLQARLRRCAPPVERVRDLVDREPAGRAAASRTLDRLDARIADVLARAQRGADVGGLLGPLEKDAARAERDLIVGASNRRAHAHDEAGPRRCAPRLEAGGRRCATSRRGAWPRWRPRRASRCPTCRRSGRCPRTPPPWTPTWCGWTPSDGR